MMTSHMAGIYSDCSTREINTVVGNFHDTQHICSNAFNGKKQQNQSDYHNEQMTGSGTLQYTAKTCTVTGGQFGEVTDCPTP